MNGSGRRPQHALNGSHAKLRLDANFRSQLFHLLDALPLQLAGVAANIGKLEVRAGEPGAPPVVVRHGLAPQLPGLARALGQQVFLGIAHQQPELRRALAHQHHVAGMFHHRFGQQRNVLDIVHARHRPRHARRPMHAAGVEFHHAIFVRQTSQPNAVIVGIIFRAGNHLHYGIQRVASAREHRIAAVEVVVPIRGADDHRSLGLRGRRPVLPLVIGCLGLSLQIESERSGAQSSGGNETAAGYLHDFS